MTTDYSNGCAFIDDEYVPIEDARIPIADTGFLRSDVTYDVVAVWKGKFFRLDDHLDRFERSWSGLHLKPYKTKAEMREILIECVRRSGIRDAYVDMIATRGVDELIIPNPRHGGNRFYAYAIPYIWIVKPDDQVDGSKMIITRDTDRISDRSVDPTIKNFHWGDLMRGVFEAQRRGATLAILPNAEGHITEGPGFNIFAVKDGTLHTPPRGVLEGITRSTVMILAKESGTDCRMEAFDADFLRSADEIFATSTAGGVMPVTELDGQAVGDGKPGEITQSLRDRYWAAHDDPRWTVAVDYE